MGQREERLIGVLDRLDKVIEENSAVHSRVIVAIDDMRDQVRANTEALLRLIDRLDGGAESA